MNRFATSMLMVLGVLAAGTASAREPSSYFSGAAAAPAKSASAPAAGKPTPSTANAKLPAGLPPLPLPPPLPAKKGAPTLPPLELPPLPGMEPMTPPTASGPKLQPQEKKDAKSEKPKGKIEIVSDDQPPKDKAEPEKEKAVSPFLSRAELEQRRKACKLDFVGNKDLSAGANGDTIRLKFRNPGEPCLSAAAPGEDWVETAINSVTSEVLLTVESNGTPEPRSTSINVLAGNQTFVFTLKQAAGRAQGCLRAKVRKVKKPLPDGFEE